MAVMAACFLTGYFTGRVTVPELAPAIVRWFFAACGRLFDNEDAVPLDG